MPRVLLPAVEMLQASEHCLHTDHEHALCMTRSTEDTVFLSCNLTCHGGGRL